MTSIKFPAASRSIVIGFPSGISICFIWSFVNGGRGSGMGLMGAGGGGGTIANTQAGCIIPNAVGPFTADVSCTLISMMFPLESLVT